MSKRLTNTLKDDIANAAKRKSPINKQIEELLERRKVLSEGIRIESLGGQANADKYKKIAEQMAKLREELPDNMLTHTMGISVTNSLYISIDDGRRYYIDLPSVAPSITGCIHITSKSAFYFDIIESLDKESQLNKDLKEVFNTVRASIAGITTVKRLVDSWPEVVELLPPDAVESKVRLPAMRVDNLNKLIGLPTPK